MPAAETLQWNIQSKFGITAEGIKQAISAAKDHFATAPNDTLVFELPKGSFWLEDSGPNKGTIDLSGIKQGPEGRLVFQGKGIHETVLVFSDNKHALFGRDVYRVTFENMHMTRRNYTVSQGLVVRVEEDHVVLDIQPGFPTPDEIFNPLSNQDRYLRQYTNSKKNPKLIQENNEQVPWTHCEPIGGPRWKLYFRNHRVPINYTKGDLIGIKSKHSEGVTEFDGQAYWFYSGEDFLFKSIKWTHKSRGVFRGGFEKVQVVDCIVKRAAPIRGQDPCLATPGGGPQIGQPNDPKTSGHLVQNCRFVAPGDDAVAFFNATGTIRDCLIRDAFARGILVANAPKTSLINNTIIRCPTQFSKEWRFYDQETGIPIYLKENNTKPNPPRDTRP